MRKHNSREITFYSASIRNEVIRISNKLISVGCKIIAVTFADDRGMGHPNYTIWTLLPASKGRDEITEEIRNIEE